MAAAYQVVLHADLVDILFQLQPRERRQVIRFFETLANRPGLPGDYVEMDSDGRENQVTVLGRWAVTYWADHAVKEVRVVALESA